jgi:hypothetical protein
MAEEDQPEKGPEEGNSPHASDARRLRRNRARGRKLAREWVDLSIQIHDANDEVRQAFDDALDDLADSIKDTSSEPAPWRGGGNLN